MNRSTCPCRLVSAGSCGPPNGLERIPRFLGSFFPSCPLAFSGRTSLFSGGARDLRRLRKLSSSISFFFFFLLFLMKRTIHSSAALRPLPFPAITSSNWGLATRPLRPSSRYTRFAPGVGENLLPSSANTSLSLFFPRSGPSRAHSLSLARSLVR